MSTEKNKNSNEAAHLVAQQEQSSHEQTSTLCDQMDFFEQLQIQLAQIGQINEAVQTNHKSVQQQSVEVLNAHQQLQSVIQNLRAALLDSSTISSDDTAASESQSNSQAITSEDLQCSFISPTRSHAESSLNVNKPTAVEAAVVQSSTSDDDDSIIVVYASDMKNGIEEEKLEQLVIEEEIITDMAINEDQHTLMDTTEPVHDKLFNSSRINDLMENDEIVQSTILMQIIEDQRGKTESATVNSNLYDTQLSSWKENVHRWENSVQKRIRDEQHRLIFERTFTNLRKTREKEERDIRAGRFSVPQVDETTNEKMLLSAAIIPELCSDVAEKNHRYATEENRVITDAGSANKEMIESFQKAWSPEEKTMFTNKYKDVGKNFSYIAKFLPYKSVKDCVLFYYLIKGESKFKTLPRRRCRSRRVYKPLPMPSQEEVDNQRLNGSPSPVDQEGSLVNEDSSDRGLDWLSNENKSRG